MRRAVTVTYCDRCPPHGRVATETRTFGFDQTWWSMDLCEQHDNMLTRELYSWGLLGQPVEDGPLRRTSSFADAAEMRRLAELRTRQSAQDRAVTTAPPIELPPDHGEWVFTQHALERMEEREVDVVEILWACSRPMLRRAGREPGNMIHERNDTKVVCDPSSKVIITVAHISSNDRKTISA